jgi:predicted phosphodiesterase
MRLAVISDIHGNLPALDAVIWDIRTRGADLIVNLGDCVTSPLWPTETLETLQSLALPTVRGNHDRLLTEASEAELSQSERYVHSTLTPEQRALLHALPPTLEPAPGILAIHGTPDSDTTFLLEELIEDGRFVPARPCLLKARLGEMASRYGVVLCGHSHLPGVVLGPAGCLIVNPGSVGCPVFADIPNAKKFEYRSPHARYALLTKMTRQWQAELIALEYDWDAASARALENQRPDWAAALATGKVPQDLA